MEKHTPPEVTKEQDQAQNQAMIKQQLIQAMIAFHGLENV